MGDDPKSDKVRGTSPSDDHGQEPSGNPLGALVDPLTKLGIDTARDIAAAVQSTRAAAAKSPGVVGFREPGCGPG